MNIFQIFKQDIKTSLSEIKTKLYHYHFLGGFLVTLLLTFLFNKYGNMPHIQPYIISIVLNILIWVCKEMIWYTAITFEKQYTWLSKFRKFKIFNWSKPDWKDVRFSFYGSIIVLLIYLFN
jgi:ABC-type Fe3+-siderophore transport system permease subunit